MEKFVLPCLLKTSTKLLQKSMFYGSVIKQQTKSIIFNIRIYSFFYKVFTYLFLFQKCVSMNVHNSPKTPTLGSPQVTINMNYKIKLNKNSKFKPPIVQWLIPICNPL